MIRYCPLKSVRLKVEQVQLGSWVGQFGYAVDDHRHVARQIKAPARRVRPAARLWLRLLCESARRRIPTQCQVLRMRREQRVGHAPRLLPR